MEVISGQERVKSARKRSRSTSHSPTKPNQQKSQNKPEEIDRIPKLHMDSTDGNGPQGTAIGSTNHLQVSQRNAHSDGISANHQGFDSQSEELKTVLRTSLREQFDEHFILSVSDMRRLFSVKLMELPHESFLSTGITDRVLEEAALDIGAKTLDLPVSILASPYCNINIKKNFHY